MCERDCNDHPGRQVVTGLTTVTTVTTTQAVKLGERAKVLAFCEAVQRCSPVGSHIRPTPGMTPGYGDEVIFADGTFVDGSTLELSADGPLREPYAVYMQVRVRMLVRARVCVSVCVRALPRARVSVCACAGALRVGRALAWAASRNPCTLGAPHATAAAFDLI